MPRPYPALAIEIQAALDIDGYAYDLNVACASAAFTIQAATAAIQQHQARAALIVNPEICTAQLNFRDRDSHFIFGDACSATIIQNIDNCSSNSAFKILTTKLLTKYSNNIRNNFGYLNSTQTTQQPCLHSEQLLFTQQGRKVFKEVVPMVIELLTSHLQQANIPHSQLKRLWLHQANLNMNQLIAKKIFAKDITQFEAPIILDNFANTSSAGSIISFHYHNQDLLHNDIGLLSAFGAGYSIGSIILQKIM